MQTIVHEWFFGVKRNRKEAPNAMASKANMTSFNRQPAFKVGETIAPANAQRLQLFYPLPETGEPPLVQRYYGDIFAEDIDDTLVKASDEPEPFTPLLRNQMTWSADKKFWYPAGFHLSTVRRIFDADGQWKVTFWHDYGDEQYNREETMPAHHFNSNPNFWRRLSSKDISHALANTSRTEL